VGSVSVLQQQVEPPVVMGRPPARVPASRIGWRTKASGSPKD